MSTENKISGEGWYKEWMSETWSMAAFLISKATEANAAILAAEREGYERGVRESVEEWLKYTQKRYGTDGFGKEHSCYQSILSLIKPAVPVWEHKPGCPTPYQWNNETQWWMHRDTARVGDYVVPHHKARYCDGCGEPVPPRPEQGGGK